MRLALAMLLLVACIGNTGDGGPDQESVAAPVGGLCAVDYARAEWSRRLDGGLLDPPTVRWFEGEALSYPWAADRRFDGYFLPWQGEIHVPAAGLPSEGALVHELLHWALVATGHDGDAAHEGAIWAQVDEVRAVLRERGL